MASDIELRRMEREDLGAARTMLAQLGYDVALDDLTQRYETIQGKDGHSLVVAVQEGSPVGLLHIFTRLGLEKPPEAVIQAVIVDRTRRGSGIGRMLMAAAEGWAREKGMRCVVLNNPVSQLDANAFFAGLGYQRAAVSALLRKDL